MYIQLSNRQISGMHTWVIIPVINADFFRVTAPSIQKSGACISTERENLHHQQIQEILRKFSKINALAKMKKYAEI